MFLSYNKYNNNNCNKKTLLNIYFTPTLSQSRQRVKVLSKKKTGVNQSLTLNKSFN
jgi:hypothetical protein